MKKFWSKVDVRGEDECWPWIAGKLGNFGYGAFRYQGKTWVAHRFAYQLVNGPIAPGNVVRHSCDNPPCCNPRHLLQGTHRDNVHDKYERGRAAHAKGEHHGNSKLTANEVQEIRRLIAQQEPIWSIAQRFNVNKQTVHSIKQGVSWAHLGRRITRSR